MQDDVCRRVRRLRQTRSSSQPSYCYDYHGIISEKRILVSWKKS
ncbi:MAG: hypothetical protein OJF50_004435 [Nitrospira sp.]|nr:hypothetical protein [Nitrospira sp.]